MKQIRLLLLILSIIIVPFNSVVAQETEKVAESEQLTQSNEDPEDFDLNQDTIFNADDSIQIPDKKPMLKTLHPKFTPLDSLYERSENGTLILPDTGIENEFPVNLTFIDTIIVNPLYLPMIFNGKILPYDLSLYKPEKDGIDYSGILIPENRTFAQQLKNYDFVAQRRIDFYKNYPDKVKFSANLFGELPTAARDSEVAETYNPFKELISTETSFRLERPDIDRIQVKRRYWVQEGEHNLHFSQSYFSPNWHKGGTGNLNILTSHILRFNYRKEKVRFNNTLEMRLSTITSPDDTLRSYRIADDLLRYNADFGIDAFGKHWSYSTNVDARTQMFNNHPVNSSELQSAFLAPLYLSGGVGLKYNLDKKSEKVRHRRVRLSFNFDPASFSYKYVGHEDVDVKRYGIEEGKKSTFDIGSTITGNLIYDFNKFIHLNSKLRYFTSYHKVEAELENTLNMALTNALSTRIFFHLRYDDKVPRDEKYGYLQLNELLSFGLNYKW